MQSETKPGSKKMIWTGRILSALGILFLLFDSVIHLMAIAPVADAFKQLGYPVELAVPLGIIELICLVIYGIPRTSMIGAVLLTGYLGGAVATQVRVGAPLFSTVLFPIYVGVLLWGGLYLRDARLRTVFQ